MGKQITQIVMNHTGDERFVVDTADANAVEKANKRFKELTGSGFLAYEPGKDGEPGKTVKNFDETAEETVFRPRLIGG